MQLRPSSMDLGRRINHQASKAGVTRLFSRTRTPCMTVHAQDVSQASSVASSATNGSTQAQPQSSREAIYPSELRTLKVAPSTSWPTLGKVLSSNKTLAASANDPNIKLKITCASPQAVFPALMALADVNVQLAGRGDAYRLQVQSSIVREVNVTTANTLDGDFTAFLFVNKVLASSLPAVSETTTYAEISPSTEFRKAATYIQANGSQGTFPVLRARENRQSILNAYKALMLARFSIYKAAMNKAMQSNQADQQQQQGSGASTGINNTAAVRVQDIAFIPMIRSVQVQSANGTATYPKLNLQLVQCDPPSTSANSALRLVTPKPSRAASEGSEVQRPRRAARTPPPRQSQPEPQQADDNKVVVDKQQWEGVQNELQNIKQLLAQLQTKQ